MGGKVRERAASETAYVHRNANFVFFIKTEWSPADSEDEIRRLHDWQTDYYADMQKYVLPQSYVNFPSEDISSALTKYYGDNLERLKTLKQRVDPENIFRFPQSIPLA
jgi:FAD/FMN-containing dehydrogenase